MKQALARTLAAPLLVCPTPGLDPHRPMLAPQATPTAALHKASPVYLPLRTP